MDRSPKLTLIPNFQSKIGQSSIGRLDVPELSESVTFDWKINPLDNLTTTDSNFLLRSPKFSCGEKVERTSEWYISIKYSPESKHLHADVSLSKINADAKEIYTRVTLYLMQSSKRVSYKLGTVERAFTSSAAEIFRKDLSICGTCGVAALKFKSISAKMLETLMADNNLIVRAELVIFKEKPSAAAKKTRQCVETSLDCLNAIAIAGSVAPWEKHRHLADCTLKCGESSFQVHIHRLKSTSPVFATIFDSFQQVGEKFNENKTAILKIQNVDPEIMELILKFMYEGTLDKEIWDRENSVEIARKILIATESYQLYQLRDVCLMEMCNNLNLKNCPEVAVLARTLQLKPIFKRRINEFLRKNWSLLQQDGKFLAIFNKYPQAFEFIFSPTKTR